MVDKSPDSPVTSSAAANSTRISLASFASWSRRTSDTCSPYMVSRGVLVGAEPYLNMVLDGKGSSEALVGLQLSALLGGNMNSMSLEVLERGRTKSE